MLFFKDDLPKSATKVASFTIDKLERKIHERRVVRAGKDFTLFIPNEDIDKIIKIVVSLGKSGLFIDGVTETVKHQIKQQEGRFLGLW